MADYMLMQRLRQGGFTEAAQELQRMHEQPLSDDIWRQPTAAAAAAPSRAPATPVAAGPAPASAPAPAFAPVDALQAARDAIGIRLTPLPSAMPPPVLAVAPSAVPAPAATSAPEAKDEKGEKKKGDEEWREKAQKRVGAFYHHPDKDGKESELEKKAREKAEEPVIQLIIEAVDAMSSIFKAARGSSLVNLEWNDWEPFLDNIRKGKAKWRELIAPRYHAAIEKALADVRNPDFLMTRKFQPFSDLELLVLPQIAVHIRALIQYHSVNDQTAQTGRYLQKQAAESIDDSWAMAMRSLLKLDVRDVHHLFA